MVEECTFSFAGKESIDYGMFVINVGSLPNTLVSGADTEIISADLSRRSSKLIYGVKENNGLKFDITLSLPKNCAFDTICNIKDWLFGHTSPQKLKFEHPDLRDYYFLCYFRYGDDFHNGDKYNAIKASVECVSPYAYKQNVSFVVSGSSPTSVWIETAELYGTQPIVEFSIPSGNPNEVSLLNQSSDTCLKLVPTTGFPLIGGTRVIINNQKKLVLFNYNSALKHLSFENNCGFLSLVNGMNIFEGTDGVDMTVTYTPTKRIGGV